MSDALQKIYQIVANSKRQTDLPTASTMQDGDYLLIFPPGETLPRRIRKQDVKFDTESFKKFPTVDDFPITGSENRLYIAETVTINNVEYKNVIYVWNGTAYETGGGIEKMTPNGGNTTDTAQTLRDDIDTNTDNFQYYILLSEKGAAQGVATLDANQKLTASQLPDLAITDVELANENTISGFATNSGNYTFQKGDVIIIDDGNGNLTHYIYKGGTKTDVNEYSEISASEVLISQVQGLQAELDNRYTKTEADNKFVPKEGNTTINGTKTFTESPIVPTPTLDEHAVNKEYVDNLIDSAGEPFVTKWNVLTNDEIILPIGTEGINNVQVDWGDGTVDNLHSHTYQSDGVFTISILGMLEDFRFNQSNVSRSKLTEIVSWGTIAWKNVNFYGCNNLSTIPVESPNLINCVSILNLFRGTAIAELPLGLLSNAPNLRVAANAFRAMPNLTTINGGLFSKSPLISSVYGAFEDDSLLTTVPADLFQGCVGLLNAANLLRDTGVTAIPENLFWDCPVLEGVANLLYGTPIESLSPLLFKNSPDISDFTNFVRSTGSWTSNIPAFWVQFPNAVSTNAISNTTVPNYSEVPESWGGPVGVPMPPQEPIENRAYWNPATDRPEWLINGEWKSVEGGGGTTKPPVDETYTDVAALLADQNNQEKDYFYEITDASGLTAVSSGAAVLLYNASTPTGTESDYVIIWSENPIGIVEQPLTDSATVNWNVSENQVARLLATSAVGNTRSVTLSNSNPGVNYQLTYIQDATGGRELDLSNFDKVYGSIDLAANAESIITVMVTNQGTSIAVITSDESTKISYNDLQDLPIRTLKVVSGNYVAEIEDKNKIVSNPDNSTFKVPVDTFEEGDVLKGVASGTINDTIFIESNNALNENPTSIEIITPSGLKREVPRNGSFTIEMVSPTLGILTGDLVKEYEITASPDGTLWKTGQVDNSGNPIAPTAL